MQLKFRVKPRFYLLLMALMLLGFGVSCGLNQLRSMQAAQRVAQLTRERQAAAERAAALARQLDYVKTDAYVERIARQELNLLYPGEIRYVAY